MAESEKATVGDLTQAYRIFGEDRPGIPLLMIQGLTAVKEDWAELAPALAEDRPVLVFDNRGMGESTVTEGPYSIEQLAGDALGLLDHVGWRKTHLMGISMGGMIAQQLALVASERIVKLVLGCTGHGGHTQIAAAPEVLAAFQVNSGETPRDITRKFMWVNATDDWIAKNPEQYATLIDEALAYRRSRRGMMHQLGAILNFDVAERISEIPHETLILHGTHDRLMPYGNAEKIAMKIARSRLIDLPGAGHLFWRMDAGESARAIREFLRAPPPHIS